MNSDNDNDDVADMRVEARAERIYHGALVSHPSCRDPEHPGCDVCQPAPTLSERADDLAARFARVQPRTQDAAIVQEVFSFLDRLARGEMELQ